MVLLLTVKVGCGAAQHIKSTTWFSKSGILVDLMASISNKIKYIYGAVCFRVQMRCTMCFRAAYGINNVF